MVRRDILRLVGSTRNSAILSALATGPRYTRELARQLGRSEGDVSRRMRSLERADLIEGRWNRIGRKNVRLYRLKVRRFEVSIEEGGYHIRSQALGSTLVPWPKPQTLPVRTPFFGREEELATLQDPTVRVHMVIGLAGMGKTSLAVELAHRIGPGNVLWHTVSPIDTADRLAGEAAFWTAEKEDRPLPEDGWPPPDPVEALRKATDGLSRSRATVILDDYHKVSHDGIHEVVRQWQRNPNGPRVVVLSRVRPPFDVNPATRVISLHGMGLDASRALIQSRGLVLTDDEMRRLQRTYGGHPLSLVLSTRPGSPSGVHTEPVGEELGRQAAETLDVQSRKILIALAAVRRSLEMDVIAELTGVEEPSLYLALLERRALVRRVGGGYGVHDVLRDALSLEATAKKDLHRRAMKRYLASTDAEDSVEALFHATQAGDLAVVGSLLEAQLLTEAEPLIYNVNADVYLDLLDRIPIDRMSRRLQILVHYARGILSNLKVRTADEVSEFEVARALAEEVGEPRLLALVLREFGDTLILTARAPEAERMLQEALELYEKEGMLSERAGTFARLLWYYDLTGDSVRAREACLQAMREAHRAGDAGRRLELSLNPMAWPQDWRRAIPMLRRLADAFRERREPWGLAMAYRRMGEINCRLARLSGKRREEYARAAADQLTYAINGFETLGSESHAMPARGWRALALHYSGRLEDAEVEVEGLIAPERGRGSHASRILPELVRSEISRNRGDLGGAKWAADRAVRLARTCHSRWMGLALFEQAQVATELHGVETSGRLLERAVRETIRTGYPLDARYTLLEARRRGLRISRKQQGRRPSAAPSRLIA